MEYNGDIINGVRVITKLNVEQLESNKIYRFMFKGADMNIGQSWYVPLLVAKGLNSGKKLLLNTGIHGDELNGARVIQKIFASLNPAQLSGTLVGVLQAAPNALLHINRNWYLSTDGGDYENMNRMFPGKAQGNTAQVHAYKLWHDLWAGNADMVVDLHSQSTDTEYPLFIYADLSFPAVKQMVELFPVDQLFNDKDELGTVEGTFGSKGIPAITLEIGSPRIFQEEYIERSIEGISNLMADSKMLNQPLGRTAATFGTIMGSRLTSIRAQVGGYAQILVKIGERVSNGQEVARQLNPFGDVVHNYLAPLDGVVASVASGATREAGGLLVRLLSD